MQKFRGGGMQGCSKKNTETNAGLSEQKNL